ncbi:hypothetical protein BZG36_04087 [Bifiguratus adelaidae]|uniref:RRM domain-containing protein n=1 Tax=Bifiguratus adelaidae TaxID=1938954 RepID=A0A261XWW7_9FUNG|nr:hypothetical protein BZG36_04087 [Bifiguratus adelaidae]
MASLDQGRSFIGSHAKGTQKFDDTPYYRSPLAQVQTDALDYALFLPNEPISRDRLAAAQGISHIPPGLSLPASHANTSNQRQALLRNVTLNARELDAGQRNSPEEGEASLFTAAHTKKWLPESDDRSRMSGAGLSHEDSIFLNTERDCGENDGDNETARLSIPRSQSSLNTRPLVSTNAFVQGRKIDEHARECMPSEKHEVPLPVSHPVVKLTNIPWDVSQKDIRLMFAGVRLPRPEEHSQPIHIMMDRATGKTLTDAFIELDDAKDVEKVFAKGFSKTLKMRPVGIQRSNQGDLMHALFPSWDGTFDGINPVQAEQSTERGKRKGTSFMSREEITSMLAICKNYKYHFSRRCPERPFESIMSIMTKYPWHAPELYSTLQRDQIYEFLKLALETLRCHLVKDCVYIDKTLKTRMLRAGIMCPVFTDKQKATLMRSAELRCPPEYQKFLQPPWCIISSGEQFKESVQIDEPRFPAADNGCRTIQKERTLPKRSKSDLFPRQKEDPNERITQLETELSVLRHWIRDISLLNQRHMADRNRVEGGSSFVVPRTPPAAQAAYSSTKSYPSTQNGARPPADKADTHDTAEDEDFELKLQEFARSFRK